MPCPSHQRLILGSHYRSLIADKTNSPPGLLVICNLRR